MTFRPKTALLLACLVTAPAASSVAQTLAPAEKTDLLQRMNGVYYSLANQNFKGMQCGLDADYASIFSSMPELKDHPEKLAEVKKQLAKIHSQIAVSATGHAKVTTSGADTDSTPALETMTTGFNQGFQGFFLAWSSFALATPFPYKAEDVDIKPTSDGYVVSKSADGASVESHFSRDLVVQQTIIDSPRMHLIEDTTFLQVTGGQVLSSMKVAMDMKPSGKLPDTEIDASYQSLGGMMLPHILTFKSDVVQGLTATLTDCKLTQ